MKIYIVEDDAEIQSLESYALSTSGFEIECFSEGDSFLRALEREKPALVLLDVMLPGKSGLELLRQLRADAGTAELPVILVTARSSELDTVRGLDLGADDYITKPFGVMELVSRVKARTRGAAGADKPLELGGIVLSELRRSVTVNGEACELTYKEFELLRLFLRHPGQVLRREQIMEQVWGYDYGGSSRTLDMHIKTLRKKLGPCGGMIRTVRNVGYCLSG